METMIEAYCKKLKIGRVFYQGYREIQAPSHEEFLLMLLKKELENREIIRRNRNLKAANFDITKLLRITALTMFRYLQPSELKI